MEIDLHYKTACQQLPVKVLSKSVVYEHRLCFHGVTLPGAKCAAAGALRKRYLTAGMENRGERVCLTLQRFK